MDFQDLLTLNGGFGEGGQLVLLQLRDRPSSKSCRQASGRPRGVLAPYIEYKTIFVY